MKTRLFLSILLMISIVACNNDEDLSSIVVQSSEVGTISLNATLKGVFEVSTSSKSSTVDDVLDRLSVAIFDNTGSQVIEDVYRNLTEFIELPVGAYDVVFFTPTDSNARFETGVYGSEPKIAFEVVRDSNTVVPVELRLFDVATTIDFSDEVLQNFPDISAKVTVAIEEGDRSLNWSAADDFRTGYITMIEYVAEDGGSYVISSGELTVEITALDTSGNQILVIKTYNGAKANQHYKLLISYAENEAVDFDIILGDEEVIEDEIPFPDGDESNEENTEENGDESNEDDSNGDEQSDVVVEGDLIITEIMNNPDTVSDANGEWFELFNTTTSKDIALNGLRIVGASSEITLSTELTIAPGSFLVLGKNGDIATNGGVTVDYVYSGFTLTNSTGSISLVKKDTVLDRVVFDDFTKEAGKAMQLNQNNMNSVENDAAEYWCLSTTALSQGDFGTPGVANEVCN